MGLLKKFIFIKFSNGRTFKLPADIIAEMRATYYACDVDGYVKNGKEYNEKFECSLEDSELFDWIRENVNWEDIEDKGEWLDSIEEYDYEDGFYNALYNAYDKIKIEEIEL